MSNNDSNTKVIAIDREAMMMTLITGILFGIAIAIKLLGEML